MFVRYYCFKPVTHVNKATARRKERICAFICFVITKNQVTLLYITTQHIYFNVKRNYANVTYLLEFVSSTILFVVLISLELHLASVKSLLDTSTLK